MSESTPIFIPLINPNEPGARLVALHVTTGQHVAKGEKICTLETTKSTQELTADRDGYLVGLAFTEGQTIQADDILAYLADTPDWVPPVPSMIPSEPDKTQSGNLRISQAALSLATRHHLDLSKFPSEQFITEKMVQELVEPSTHISTGLLAEQYHPQDLIVYGGGGHGKALIDLIRILDTFSIVGIVDDNIPVGTSIMHVPVLGGASILGELLKRGLHLAANAVGGIGNITSRINVFERLAREGFTCPVLTHPTAFIEISATLAEGVQVMPHAYIGSEAKVGFGVIVNTGAIISHDCVLGEYANLSPGAILAGEVNVGAATLVGMGVTVNLRVKIGSQARIGNGATIKQDVPDSGIVRAGTIWPE
ncbi:MAG TPA: NeuD/PglB/VioB family sugar acetyltransferase [Anaerolineales bacterium]|nr:NeuD/PglB/VioB family sugar acetyltransferase [Anaerolineales bacterium]